MGLAADERRRQNQPEMQGSRLTKNERVTKWHMIRVAINQVDDVNVRNVAWEAVNDLEWDEQGDAR